MSERERLLDELEEVECHMLFRFRLGASDRLSLRAKQAELQKQLAALDGQKGESDGR